VLFNTILSDYTSNNSKLAISVACRFRQCN